MLAIDFDETLASGRFGPLERGATHRDALEQLGPPVTYAVGKRESDARIWLYGHDISRGFLEFHFDADHSLWMIFADHLPLRRIRSARFRFDPGCLGGITRPTAHAVTAHLRARGVRVALEPLDPRWSDPPPPDGVPTIEDWSKTRRRLVRDSVESFQHAALKLENGITLHVCYETGLLPSGTQVRTENLVNSVTIPMNRQ